MKIKETIMLNCLKNLLKGFIDKLEITCKDCKNEKGASCSSLLEINKNDVTVTEGSTNFGRFPVYYIQCPVCLKTVYLKD